MTMTMPPKAELFPSSMTGEGGDRLGRRSAFLDDGDGLRRGLGSAPDPSL